MNDRHVKTLLIEDSADDALLLQRELADAKRAHFDTEWVERLSTALERLTRGGIDVVLLDLSLPDSSGADTLRRVHAQAPSVPIVILTGLDDEALGIQLLKEGAQDYLVKAHVDGDLLVRSMLYAIERHGLLSELQSAKESAEAHLRTVVNNTPIIIFALDRAGVFTLSEGQGLEALGHQPGEMVGKLIFEVYRETPQILENVRAALNGEPRSLTVDVAGVTLEARYEPLRDHNDEVVGVVGVAHDVTERTRLAEQLLQSQKMEAVGQLAGGIAHDFNNLLSAILGYCQLGVAKASSEAHVSRYLQEIGKAAEQATHLTRQLLAFSRRQVIEPEVVNINDLIVDMQKMFRRLIGEDIELVSLLSPNLGLVKVDPGQMEQLLMNLALNARDAMTEGGTLTIETADVDVDHDHAEQHPEVPAGEYVTLAVRDTGVGMTGEVRAHAFEPFFTTKEVGKGTGLGLSTCYGIVKQSGGHITVDSEEGLGTNLAIYLPKVGWSADALPSADHSGPPPAGHETVLLVEDEPSVRGVCSEALREQGYKVLEAANGVEGMRIAHQRADRSRFY